MKSLKEEQSATGSEANGVCAPLAQATNTEVLAKGAKSKGPSNISRTVSRLRDQKKRKPNKNDRGFRYGICVTHTSEVLGIFNATQAGRMGGNTLGVVGWRRHEGRSIVDVLVCGGKSNKWFDTHLDTENVHILRHEERNLDQVDKASFLSGLIHDEDLTTGEQERVWIHSQGYSTDNVHCMIAQLESALDDFASF